MSCVYASTEGKKPAAASVSATETVDSSMCEQLKNMRGRLRPVKPPASPTKKSDTTEDRKTTPGAGEVPDLRKPPPLPAAEVSVSVSPASRVANANSRSPSKQASAAAESGKSHALQPPLPSRTRQTSPSPQRTTHEEPTTTLDGGASNAKEPTAAVDRETGDRGHLPGKVSGQRVTTPNRLAADAAERSGT